MGESLLFSSQALLDVNPDNTMTRLGGWHKKMMTRPRMSKDGGTSVVANRVSDVTPNRSAVTSAPITLSAPPQRAVNGIQGSKYAQMTPPSSSSSIAPNKGLNAMPSISPGLPTVSAAHASGRLSTIPPSQGTVHAPSCDPMVETEAGNKLSIFMCLAATEMFRNYSPEEMRIGDILEGRGGKVQA